MNVIDGQEIAEQIFERLRAQKTPKKELAAILVGQDPASKSFLRQKEKTAKTLGVKFKLYELSSTLTQEQLERKVRSIADKKNVGGVIVQLPLPKKYDRVPVLNAIGIEKDVDVLNGETSPVLAPAAGALFEILESIKFNLKNKEVAVVGSGLLIGRPVATAVMSKCRKLTVVNKGGLSLTTLKKADLVVTGVGVPSLVKGVHLKKNCVVVDFGYAKKRGALAGDVDFKTAEKKAKFITPVPGGTGPIVVAKLFENFYTLQK